MQETLDPEIREMREYREWFREIVRPGGKPDNRGVADGGRMEGGEVNGEAEGEWERRIERMRGRERDCLSPEQRREVEEWIEGCGRAGCVGFKGVESESGSGEVDKGLANGQWHDM
jgi:hypothetical protein